jgi:outer membrane protein TolC
VDQADQSVAKSQPTVSEITARYRAAQSAIEAAKREAAAARATLARITSELVAAGMPSPPSDIDPASLLGLVEQWRAQQIERQTEAAAEVLRAVEAAESELFLENTP